MEKASKQFRTVCNPGGPVLTTIHRKILEKDGLFFKDLDGSGEFRDFDDWRLPPKERAEAVFLSIIRFSQSLTRKVPLIRYWKKSPPLPIRKRSDHHR